MVTAMKRIYRTRKATSQYVPPDPLLEHLRPLAYGHVVKLVIQVRKTSGLHQREMNYLMLIAPGKMYGMKPELLHVAVLEKGSFILNPIMGKGLSALTKMGLPTPLAVDLIEKLKKLFGET